VEKRRFFRYFTAEAFAKASVCDPFAGYAIETGKAIMKLTPQIFSIPPYISTRWDFVLSLRVSDNVLIVTLKDGTTCTIPDLSKETIDQIFAFHTEAEEAQDRERENLKPLLESMKTGFKDLMQMLSKLGTGVSGPLGRALEHDPRSANLPELPPDMVKKVQMLLNVIPKEDLLAMPENVAGCHCMYCQINRILRKAIEAEEEGMPDVLAESEPVEEKDLQFSEWIVEPIADKLYKVTSPLNHTEEYRVFLGDPIGCTCGKPRCEHILAVLRS
jgi:hypothetical protein